MAMAWDWMPFSCTSVDEYVNGDGGGGGGGKEEGRDETRERMNCV